MNAPRLSAHNLAVSRGGRPVLADVALRLEAGQLAWLGGASGTGKSTLLLALARLLPRDAGELAVDGVPAGELSGPAWRSRVLLVPHPPCPLGETVAEDLVAPFSLHQRRHATPPGRDTLRRELDALGLEEVALEHPARQLSQGQLGRLALARALLAAPAALLLDEPTANLDRAAAARVEQRVAAYCAGGGAAVVAGHGEPWGIPRGELAAGPAGGGR